LFIFYVRYELKKQLPQKINKHQVILIFNTWGYKVTVHEEINQSRLVTQETEQITSRNLPLHFIVMSENI
jgi:hypothetical protein